MAKTKFRPLHDRVVVRRVESEEKTSGGIIIPDTAKEKPIEGEVIAVGPGARDEAGKLVPLDVKAGDRVLFGKWSGTEVKLDGQELLAIELHFGAGPLAEQDAVAGLDVERAEVALVVQSAAADGDDFAFLRLFLGGVGDDDAARGLLFGRDTANEDAVVQGTEFHGVLSKFSELPAP